MVAKNKSVLIVDDEEVVRESYRRVLSNAGYSVHSAMDGGDALDVFEKNPCDVVLTDLRLPGMDGLDVLAKLREASPELPAVVITGYPSTQTAEKAEELGVWEYLSKPVMPSTLVRATSQALESGAPVLASPAPVPVPAGGAQPVAPAREEAPAKKAQRGSFFQGMKSLGLLVGAPFIGLAYVLFLPFLGIGMVLTLMASSLFKLIRPRREAGVEAGE